MDDFYIYYEPNSVENLAGVIKAVAPTSLAEMGDMPSIRVSAEVGLEFINGTESLTYWVVKWDTSAAEMRLVRQTPEVMSVGAPRFLEPISTRQKKAQVVVTWHKEKNTFNVRTRGVSLSHPDITLAFFITRRDEPAILHYSFMVQLVETMNRKGYDIVCDADIPSQFSVYTKHDMDRYQLRIER